MGYDFNMDEIFEMAEQIEKNGAKFYREAADRIAEPPNKNLLIKLAEMEDQHQKTFAFLRTQLSEGEKAPAVFDPDGEAALYLRALADIRIFFEKEIDVTSMETILKEALVAEKDSIVFYLGMKDLVPDDLGKEKIDQIIKEEMAHIKLLSNQLLALKQQ
ncbi:MAG: ferritin family protein [Deltaproteobacteria bacterium]|nr:ferritin family protein [Deltaproteobacteria bacterium]